jgi:hypothetical protein
MNVKTNDLRANIHAASSALFLAFIFIPIKSFFMEHPIPNGYSEAPNK